ncbi:hypothetical protein CIK99_03430 [Prevotella sp. P5-92]|nr:hypothetical protein CIK99_03430 [Prevotella sp. P5-92]
MDGESMSEWKEVKLGDVGKIVGGATPSTRNPQNYGGVIPWITPKDLSINKERFIEFGERNISEQGFNSCSAKMLPKGSILFSSRAPIGYVAIAHTSLCTNQGFKSFVPDTDKMDSMFSYYLLKHNSENIANLGSGTTFMEVSGKVMSDYIVNIPDLSTQREIAGILSSLDAKIETNNKLNVKLEEMAQAIFKSWFVDFEPFKDRPFHETELGMIPEGWEVGSILDIAELFDYQRKPLSSMEREYMKGKYPYYGATSIMDYIDKYIFDGTYLLMGEDGSVVKENGNPYLQYVWGKFWPNNHAHVMQGRNGFSTEMLYCLLSITDVSSIVTGAVQMKISQRSMSRLLTVIPSKSVCKKFNTIIRPIFDIIKRIREENDRLASLRDTLLPRLMSGEIKI